MINDGFSKLNSSLINIWKQVNWEQVQLLWTDVLYIIAVAGAVFGAVHQLLIEFSF